MSGLPTLGESSPKNVKVDGEEAVLHITDQSVMFEKSGKVSGFDRSAIRFVKPDGDVMIIAYSADSEVKSVRVEPMTSVVSLLMPTSSPSPGPNEVRALASKNVVDEVFEKLYRETRKELEERLAKVQGQPEDKSLRLTPEEERGYSIVWNQMVNMLGTKYGFNLHADDSPLSFWGLENRPYELQLDVVKTLHILFLWGLVSPKAETEDIGYSSYEVWPDDWERILVRFGLADGPFLTEQFKIYLRSHWKYKPGDRRPVLAQL